VGGREKGGGGREKVIRDRLPSYRKTACAGRDGKKEKRGGEGGGSFVFSFSRIKLRVLETAKKVVLENLGKKKKGEKKKEKNREKKRETFFEKIGAPSLCSRVHLET